MAQSQKSPVSKGTKTITADKFALLHPGTRIWLDQPTEIVDRAVEENYTKEKHRQAVTDFGLSQELGGGFGGVKAIAYKVGLDKISQDFIIAYKGPLPAKLAEVLPEPTYIIAESSGSAAEEQVILETDEAEVILRSKDTATPKRKRGSGVSSKAMVKKSKCEKAEDDLIKRENDMPAEENASNGMEKSSEDSE